MKRIFTFFTMMTLTIVLSAQIPQGYYDGTEGLDGEALKDALHDIIDNHDEYSYNDLRDFILRETDEDPNNPNNVILLYTGRSQPKSTFGGGADDWNREHVWAKSHGDFGNNPPAGTDAHHIRPTDASVNSSRGNLDFDNGGQQHNEAPGCYFDDDSWEPRDAVKGDVARMIFYMDVRYDGSDGVADLEVVDEVDTYPNAEHGKLSTLLEWHLQDLPDDFELNRNEVIYGYQENRNPFIDHPEFATAIWGDPTAVDELEKQMVKVYPVPAKNHLNVVLPSNSRNMQATIYGITGQVLLSSGAVDAKQFSLDVSGLERGIYFVKVMAGGEMIKSVKFSKN
jgi:endonuclease I